MTDFAASPAEGRRPIYQRHQNLILVVAGAVMVAVAAAIIYSFAASGGGSVTMGLIHDDVTGQFVTQSVSCHKAGWSDPTLTRSEVFACDVSGVAEPNRPRGHIHDSAFTRCYIRSHSDQTVDVSHAVQIISQDRHQKPPSP